MIGRLGIGLESGDKHLMSDVMEKVESVKGWNERCDKVTWKG